MISIPSYQEIRATPGGPPKGLYHLIEDVAWQLHQQHGIKVTRQGIPRIFHQIWFGGKLPEKFQSFSETWKKQHPRWRYTLWNEDNLPTLTNQKLFDKARTPAEKSDIARLEILERHGGVYVDTDYECTHNISELINDTDFFIVMDKPVWQEHNIPYLNNAFIGCTPHHTHIQMLVKSLPKFVKDNQMEHICFRTGPGFVSQKLRKKSGVKVLDAEMLQDKYAMHHYANSWKTVEPQR